MAVVFGVAALIAVALGKAPVPQNPWLISRADDSTRYNLFTTLYIAISVASLFLAFFRLPWVALSHIRAAFVLLFALLLAQLLYNLFLIGK